MGTLRTGFSFIPLVALRTLGTNGARLSGIAFLPFWADRAFRPHRSLHPLRALRTDRPLLPLLSLGTGRALNTRRPLDAENQLSIQRRVECAVCGKLCV